MTDLSSFGIEGRDNFLTWFEQLAEKRSQLAEIKRIADSERERIAAWESRESEALKNDVSYLEAAISEEYKAKLKENPKFKCTTPWGKATKRTSTKWSYTDENQLVKDIENHPELIKTKTTVEKSVDKNAFKKAVKVLDDGRVCIDGEILESVTAVKETTVYIETED